MHWPQDNLSKRKRTVTFPGRASYCVNGEIGWTRTGDITEITFFIQIVLRDIQTEEIILFLLQPSFSLLPWNVK